jgi:nucleotide-binding universal stress UspA family protein
MTTSHHALAGPMLFCYDGSDGSREALTYAAGLLDSRGPAVVLTVWESIALRLASGPLFAPLTMLPSENDIDEREERAARAAAEEGVRRGREAGWDVEARVERAELAVWRTIVDVADEIDARLIVCGSRGLSGIRGLLVGSVSHAVIQHARRPVILVPEPALVAARQELAAEQVVGHA